MSIFKNLKIRAKLIISFVVIAIFTGIVGTIGLINMNSLNQDSNDMYNDTFLPMLSLQKIQIALEEIRANNIYIIYDADPDKLQARLDEIDKYVAQDNQAIAEYEQYIKDPQDKQLFDKFKADLLEYRKVRTNSLDLAKAGKMEDARIVAAQVSILREQVSKDLDLVIEENLKDAVVTLDTNRKHFNSQLILLISIIAGAIVLAILLGLYVANIISKPVNKMVEAARKLALGDIKVNVEVENQDEIGSLAGAFDTMIENIRSQAFTAEKIAAGDLTVNVEVKSDNDLLGKKLSELVANNNEILSDIAIAAEQVAVGAKQVSDSSMTLSQGATEQASSVEELTASLEEIASQTELNANNANQANELAENAKVNAIQGNSQMKELLTAMEDINDSSANISKVIKVIDDIAFQTNILALNAAVEAARAGQHGKGFAVVAEEVRNLAARSANAANETTDMIEGSIKKAENGTKIAKNTADALNQIVTSIEKVANLVSEIAVASNEQAMGITQINQGILQVSQVVQNNSATSEESASASEELSNQAAVLKETVRKYKLKKVAKSYGNYEDISPEVLMMLENMTEKKKNRVDVEVHEETSLSKPKIVLNDNEFGKY